MPTQPLNPIELVLGNTRELREDLRRTADDVAEDGKRLAKLEGIVETLAKAESNRVNNKLVSATYVSAIIAAAVIIFIELGRAMRWWP